MRVRTGLRGEDPAGGPVLSGSNLALAVLVAAAAIALVVVDARGMASSPGLQDRVHSVASTLRCTVCQGLSVADSPAPLAREMRARIARELRAGKTPEEVRRGFVAAYGEWVLLTPPRRGFNLVAWIAPLLLLAGGLGAAGFLIHRWTAHGRRTPGGPGSSGDAGLDRLSIADRQLLERERAISMDTEDSD